MTLVLNLDNAPVKLDRIADAESLKDVIVIVRGPVSPTPQRPVRTTPSWIFDDNDLVTWEDAEWQ